MAIWLKDARGYIMICQLVIIYSVSYCYKCHYTIIVYIVLNEETNDRHDKMCQLHGRELLNV